MYLSDNAHTAELIITLMMNDTNESKFKLVTKFYSFFCQRLNPRYGCEHPQAQSDIQYDSRCANLSL